MTVATGILFADPQVKPLSTSGQFQAGCYYCFFVTGTTTPTNVYADGALATPLSQPTPGSVNPTGGTVAASDGRLVPIYLNPAVIYRVQLYSAAGVKLEDTDPYLVPVNTANSYTWTGEHIFNPGAGVGVTINADTGYSGLEVNGAANTFAAVIAGANDAGESYGLQIANPTGNAGDIPFEITVGGTAIFGAYGSGQVYVYAPNSVAASLPANCYEVGYQAAPYNAQSTNYTLALTDRGGFVDMTGGSAYTLTIPANASVAFPVGTMIMVYAGSASGCTVAITTDTLAWVPSSAVGTRTLAEHALLTLYKATSTGWLCWGFGIS